MRILELQPGQFMTRDTWGNKYSRGNLCIGLHSYDGKLYYYDHGVKSSPVRENSSAYKYTDFRLCTVDAQPLSKEKEIPMVQYKDVNIIVTTTATQVPQVFANEEDALEYVADQLEKAPRTKFTMFKPYQKVEPKRVTLTDLITKIVS